MLQQLQRQDIASSHEKIQGYQTSAACMQFIEQSRKGRASPALSSACVRSYPNRESKNLLHWRSVGYATVVLFKRLDTEWRIYLRILQRFRL